MKRKIINLSLSINKNLQNLKEHLILCAVRFNVEKLEYLWGFFALFLARNIIKQTRTDQQGGQW